MTNIEFYQHQNDEVRNIVQQDETRVPFGEWVSNNIRWWSFEELKDGFARIEFKDRAELLLWAVIATFVIITLYFLISRRCAKKRTRLQKKKE